MTDHPYPVLVFLQLIEIQIILFTLQKYRAIFNGWSKCPVLDAQWHWIVHRTKEWRYIRYMDGSDKLYDLINDSYEWNNVADDKSHVEIKHKLRMEMMELNNKNP